MMRTNPSRSDGRFHVEGPRPERPWQFRVGFWLLLAIAAFYLLTEHRAHLAWSLPYLPFLILAACPLIHLFAHGGHGGHRHSQGKSPNSAPPSRSTEPDATAHKAEVTHRHEGDLP